MSAARGQRQQAIRAIVRSGTIRTQNELVETLAEQGFEVTQATISRDITDMSLQKAANGTYILPEDLRLQSAGPAIVETRRAGNQVLVLTQPGSAPSIAAALDDAEIPGVLGSIAGDDTILVITQDDEAGRGFQSRFERLIIR